MKIPWCTACETDRFLKFARARPGTEMLANGAGHAPGPGSAGDSPNTADTADAVGRVVRYFCQACGTADAHGVPDSWVQPPGNPDLEDLERRGEVWFTSTRRSERKADGCWITSIEV